MTARRAQAVKHGVAGREAEGGVAAHRRPLHRLPVGPLLRRERLAHGVVAADALDGGADAGLGAAGQRLARRPGCWACGCASAWRLRLGLRRLGLAALGLRGGSSPAGASCSASSCRRSSESFA